MSTAPPADIPRIIHHIWLGSALPKRLARVVASWRVAHPGWAHVLWDDAAVRGLPWYNAAAVASAGNWGQVSDVMRYEILAATGGVYVDVDMQAVRPLDALVRAANGAAILGVSNTAAFELNNAVLAAPPGHALLLDLIARIHAAAAARPVPLRDGGSDGGGGGGFMDTIATTGPGAVTRAAFAALDRGACTLWAGGAVCDSHAPSPFSPPAALDVARWETAAGALRRAVSAVTRAPADFPPLLPAPLPNDLMLAPARLFYPLPNTAAAALSPTALACSDADWDELMARAAAARSPPATADPLDALLGPDVMRWTHTPAAPHASRPQEPSCLAVHYWARTWQRAAAQRPVP